MVEFGLAAGTLVGYTFSRYEGAPRKKPLLSLLASGCFRVKVGFYVRPVLPGKILHFCLTAINRTVGSGLQCRINIVFNGGSMKKKKKEPYKCSCGYVKYMATSCTTDEAVKIMLGLLKEPVMWVCEDPRDYEDYPDPTLSLMEKLDGMIEDALIDCDEALENHCSAEELAVKKAVVAEWREKKKTATAYLRHIVDELAKGASSELRTCQDDVNGSGNVQITLRSLRDWSLKNYQIAILDAASAKQDGLSTTAQIKRPRTKMLDQKDAILDEIKRRGQNPKSLPKHKNNAPGIKSDVKSTLAGNALFISPSAFKRAWEDMVGEEIIYLE